MWFKFQQSKIWEAGDPVDPYGQVKRIKGKSLDKAVKRLPDPGLGRRWVAVEDAVPQ